jgi:hypothetical protein
MGSQKRLHSRTKCYSYCRIMCRDGNIYEALLGDISLGGALVKVSSDTHLHVGDLCDLMLSDNSALFPLKHTVKIVRFDSQNMGVCFLNR